MYIIEITDSHANVYQKFSKLQNIYIWGILWFTLFIDFHTGETTLVTLCSRRFIDTFASQFAVIRIPIISPTRNKSNKLHVHRDAPMIISAGSANGPPQSDIGFRALSLPYCWRTVWSFARPDIGMSACRIVQSGKSRRNSRAALDILN